jgi:hypothetical protein
MHGNASFVSRRTAGHHVPHPTHLTSARLLLALAAVLVACSGCTKRVSREHAAAPDPEYLYLTTRPGFPDAVADTRLTRREAEEDLDQLEWLIENQYSYRDRIGFDYRAALDAIRCGLGDGIARSDFAYQLHKLVAGFGDGHTRVLDPDLKRGLCSRFLPFLVDEAMERLVAFKADRSDFLAPGFPFLRELDGRPVEDWLAAASRLAPAGSPQLQRLRAIRSLRYIEPLRSELALPPSSSVTVLLGSPDSSNAKEVVLPLASECPIYGAWPRTESRILPHYIGYLRIAPLMEAGPEALEALRADMDAFRDTNGIIIDIRHNGGGSRAPLRVLLPYFMSPDDEPRVVNVAAYRLGMEGSDERFELRYLFPPDSPHFSEAERAAVRDVADTFQPEWQPPRGEFSDWHYVVISPAQNGRCFYYDGPVVVLMDRCNFSAADIFLGAFKGLPNVTLMGQPSGGGSGCRVKHRLDHSLISIALSAMASYRPDGRLYDGRGIEPDILRKPIPAEFIGRTDLTLDAAVAHLLDAQP